ncbi:hypothetical protein ASPWEDRAFT_175783 [Aspergillus wentii DTO 134E9]|uniref:Alkaline phytoceramidase n=1 Tax=Aspergillus wentii DTO 134E9 TaxID=1073089 RepID=A0A1L9RC63_ASPWE|nr:uncharacterized protein ASPWEDRAFT_175783 [Aspergillus wentii DTO 134E9]OJJ32502.1 hypothetical protein ASPWEDRAFT_175783 [Aspergillus wentii DTO 134E9]
MATMLTESPNTPFWGPPTAQANFCEEDYVVTRYIAEFINTMTNLTYILYALYGIHRLRQKANSNILRALPYWGLMGVGICSGIFHTSLKYHTQMMDDLSMLLTTTPILHRVLTVGVERGNSILVAILLGSILTTIVIFHVATDELLLHSLFFVGSIAVIAIFHLGYFVWIVDRWACGFLKEVRAAVGLPWAFLFELHGWWHIFTGMGAYIFIAAIDHLTSNDSDEEIEKAIAWPGPWASRSSFAGKFEIGPQAGLKRE